MEYIEISAKSVDEALTEASIKLGIPSSEIEYEVVEKGSTGFLGIGIGLFIQLILLSNTKSFGVSYLSPYVPVTNMTSDASYFIPPMWRREKRADFLNTKHSRSQGKISMKWKFGKGNK